MQSREHWNRVYQETSSTEVSWYQSVPTRSLAMIESLGLPAKAAIVDIGGGASTLVDHLLAYGFDNVTVVDLSGAALAIARERLGPRADLVRWIEADVTQPVLPQQSIDVWHDRAVFHFLAEPEARSAYVEQARRVLRASGHLIIATFAADGPTQCSGLPVMRYDVAALEAEFASGFVLVEHHAEAHHTPGGSSQAFIYCRFVRVAETAREVGSCQ